MGNKLAALMNDTYNDKHTRSTTIFTTSREIYALNHLHVKAYIITLMHSRHRNIYESAPRCPYLDINH